MALIPQSTAYTRLFFMIDSGDHLSGKTGATVTVNICKGDGTTFGIPTGSGTIAQVNAISMPGWYRITFTTTDTNTVGDLAVLCTASGCDPTYFCDQVGPVAANAVEINGDALDDYNAQVKLKSLEISNDSGHGVYVESSFGHAVEINAVGISGCGVLIEADDNPGVQIHSVGSNGVSVLGGTSGAAVQYRGKVASANAGLEVIGGNTADSDIIGTLSADALDVISTDAPTGVATTFREMIVQTWRRFFKKSVLSSTQFKTYADDGSTVVTTQIVSETGTTQTQGSST